jgi:hypothetical protein
MILGQEVMEITNLPTFCWRSSNKGSFSTDIHAHFFHLLSVWFNSCIVFSPEPHMCSLHGDEACTVVQCQYNWNENTFKYEEDFLLSGCAVQCQRKPPTFQRCLLPPWSWSNVGSKHLWNVVQFPRDYTAQSFPADLIAAVSFKILSYWPIYALRVIAFDGI